jgi:nitric oxide reductase NorQ protein
VLIAAARIHADGVPLAAAARAAVAGPLTDDPAVGAGLREVIAAYLDVGADQ